MKLDVSSLAHTKWECKYHIVFAPKYRRQIIYGKIKQELYLPLFCTSSSMRRFQSALSGRAARTLHTASLMTS